MKTIQLTLTDKEVKIILDLLNYSKALPGFTEQDMDKINYKILQQLSKV